MSKKEKKRRSTIHREEVTKEEEAMEGMVEDEEWVRSYVTIAINLNILPGIARTPIQHVSIVMPPTMS